MDVSLNDDFTMGFMSPLHSKDVFCENNVHRVYVSIIYLSNMNRNILPSVRK